MRPRNSTISGRLLTVVLPWVLVALALFETNSNMRAATQQESASKTAKSADKRQTSPAPKTITPANTSRSDDLSNDKQSSSREKRKLAMSLLDDVLLGSDRIDPIEYRVLAQIEAATLLWQSDQEAAVSLLGTACETMRKLKEKDPDAGINSKQRRLRFLAYLKIARLKPDLVKQFALNKSVEDGPGKSIAGEWTEEARAVISIAFDQIENNPALAAELAQQTLALGQIDWATFLRKLSTKDPVLSEQLARTVLGRLRDSSLPPAYILNLNRFALSQERSSQLKESYFQCLAARLNRNIGPNARTAEIDDDIGTTRAALRFSAGFPRWQAEFEAIILGFEELLRARSVSTVGAGQTKTITIPMPDDISPADTQQIVEAVPRVERISESRTRDSKYRELATKAALSSDLRLAENLTSKIEDESIRNETTIAIFSPFVRKALSESDWASAREYAARIADPIGRTLIFDRIAQSMSQSGKDKQTVRDTYNFASYKLQRETPTEDVARSYLILAKSLSSVELEDSYDALAWAVHLFNKLTRNGKLMADYKVSGSLALWVKVPVFSIHDEVLDLSEMIGPIFREMAKRSLDRTRMLADGFAHQGLYSFAELGIVRGLLDEFEDSKHAVAGHSNAGKTTTRNSGQARPPER